jgi:hypothetical protein
MGICKHFLKFICHELQNDPHNTAFDANINFLVLAKIDILPLDVNIFAGVFTSFSGFLCSDCAEDILYIHMYSTYLQFYQDDTSEPLSFTTPV